MIPTACDNGMSFELVMPKLGLTNTEGTIAAWNAQEGASVKKGDIILEIENEKTTIDFECPADGILHILATEGTEVLVGNLMGYLADNQEEYASLCSGAAAGNPQVESASGKSQVGSVGETSSAADTGFTPSDVSDNGFKSTARVPGERVKASPLARKVASKSDLDLVAVPGTGPGGRIVIKDVEQYLTKRAEISAAASSHAQSAVRREPGRIPLTATRKAIAKRMYESLRSMAQTSDSVEIDVTELAKLRKKLAAREAELGTKITMNDLFCMAAVKMLAKHPLANAELSDQEIITYPYVNLSVAVATNYGLTSPVVRDADQLTLIQLSKALKETIDKARDNKLTMSDLTGGTFTITNMGIFPVDNFNPIINPPQSAILGFGRAVEKPAVVDGQIVIRTMMVLSITYDHRVFDGSEVGSIMRDMKEYLENPEMILL